MSDSYDPGEHTVDEVVEYAEEHPDQVEQIRDAENDGKSRVTLLDKLDSMLADQGEDDDEDDEEEPPAEEEPPTLIPDEIQSEEDRRASFRSP